MKNVVALSILALVVFAGPAMADVVHGNTSLSISAGRAVLSPNGARVVVSGSLQSPVDFCRVNRTVRLFAKTGGSSRRLGTDRTGAGGVYRFAIAPPAKAERVYVAYAGMVRTGYGLDHRCGASHSASVLIRGKTS